MSWRSMFIEDDGSWPGLGFNPAKGDTEALGLLASDVKAVGEELEELHELIKKAGEHGSWWEGEAAERFSTKLGELPKYLKQGTDSMQDCAKALRGWQSKLETFQQRAEKTETDAVEARKRADEKTKQHQSLYTKYAPTFGQPMPVDQADRINTQLENARQDAEAANDRLDELIREGERIYANWKDRAGEAERAILEASENHPPDLGFWDRMADSLKGAWDGFKDWLVENADTLSNVSSALAVAALAVNAIPVVGQVASAVLGTASALCAAGAMAGHWMDNARGGKSSGWKIGLDALGVIPVVGGPAKAAIGGIKGVAKGAGVAAKAKGGLSGLTNARAVGREIYEGVENPLSTKAINAGLTKAFGTGAPPAAITGFVKTTSLVTHQVTGGSETQAQAAPTGGKFHKALAA